MLLGLDHVNIRTADVERLRSFYVEALGLRVGPRPAFSFGGAWLYVGDAAAVHLVEVERAPAPPADLGIEHFAFRATGLADLLERLRALGIPVRIGFARGAPVCQVNVHDPDGNHIHVDFPLTEAQALGLAPE